MTAAQRLIAQVAPKLKAEGVVGIPKRQLGLKFGAVDATVLSRIDHATMAELECWTERILTASSIEEVLG